jgi:hypothetical protein
MLLVNAGLSYGDTVIVSNLTATVNGTGTIYNSGPPQEYAQEFVTGSSSEVLSSIVVALGGATGTFSAGAELLANSGGLPDGTIVSAFTVPTIPTSSFSNVTFTPMSSVTLAPNTDYWFVLAASGTGGSYQWQYTNTLSTSFPNYAVSTNSGSTWTIGTPPGPFLLQANAVSAVPEPSSLVLVTCGFLTFAVVLIRRRRKVVQG